MISAQKRQGVLIKIRRDGMLNTAKNEKTEETPMIDKRLTAGKRSFLVRSENTLSDIDILSVSEENGVCLYAIVMRIADKDGAGDAHITWDEPLSGITGFWAPCFNRHRLIPQSWYPQRVYSGLTDGAPIASLFTADSANQRTFALSESERAFELSVWLQNDPGRDTLRVSLHAFKNEAPAADEFTLMLRIDERPIPLADSVRDVSAWWRGFYPAADKTYTENFAGDKPLFSSWYACFQDPRQEVLERELPVIAGLGFGSIIIDDGWSYDGRGDGAYSYCGAWEVSAEKFPDMAGFVKKAHAAGIQTALWFPVPFIGMKNPDYEKFRGMMLADTMGAGVLDPRFPAVREYIVKSYVRILTEYGFDGLKLDFLTDFNRPAQPGREGTDCASVNEGVTKLLDAIEKEVRSLNKDMMIEYRQNYIGPSVIRHCNMLRVGDCAYDFISNRLGTVDLRMLDYPLAVHADMLLWGPDETPENIAVMLLNVLFSVPQISVLSASADEAQRAVLAAYLRYWTAHRELLLHGRMTVTDPQANYTLVSAEDEALRIAVLYAPLVYVFDGKDADLFNAAECNSVYVDSRVGASAVCRDVYGSILSETVVPAGVAKLPVPKGGSVYLRAQ